MSDLAIQTLSLADARRGPSAFRPMMHGQSALPIITHACEVRVDPYAQGVADGQDMANAAFAVERESYQALLSAADALQAEPAEEMAQLIAETVQLLVCQIVNDQPVDAKWLVSHARKAAEVIADCDAARTLRMHPEDMALVDGATLPLPFVADPSLPRGELRIDGSAGWIEHGRSLYLNDLRSALASGDVA
jgi:flagellar assembly protein FliH